MEARSAPRNESLSSGKESDLRLSPQSGSLSSANGSRSSFQASVIGLVKPDQSSGLETKVHYEKPAANPGNDRIICLRTGCLREDQICKSFWNRVEYLKTLGYSAQSRPLIEVNVVTRTQGSLKGTPEDYVGFANILCHDKRLVYAFNGLNFDGSPRQTKIVTKIEKEVGITHAELSPVGVAQSKVESTEWNRVDQWTYVWYMPSYRGYWCSRCGEKPTFTTFAKSSRSWADSVDDDELPLPLEDELPVEEGPAPLPTIAPPTPGPMTRKIVEERIDIHDEPSMIQPFEWTLEADQINFWKQRGKPDYTSVEVTVAEMRPLEAPNKQDYSDTCFATFILPDEVTVEHLALRLSHAVKDRETIHQHRFGDGTVLRGPSPLIHQNTSRAYKKRTILAWFADSDDAKVASCMYRQLNIKIGSKMHNVIIVNAFNSAAGFENEPEREAKPAGRSTGRQVPQTRSPGSQRPVAIPRAGSRNAFSTLDEQRPRGESGSRNLRVKNN